MNACYPLSQFHGLLTGYNDTFLATLSDDDVLKLNRFIVECLQEFYMMKSIETLEFLDFLRSNPGIVESSLYGETCFEYVTGKKESSCYTAVVSTPCTNEEIIGQFKRLCNKSLFGIKWFGIPVLGKKGSINGVEVDPIEVETITTEKFLVILMETGCFLDRFTILRIANLFAMNWRFVHGDEVPYPPLYLNISKTNQRTTVDFCTEPNDHHVLSWEGLYSTLLANTDIGDLLVDMGKRVRYEDLFSIEVDAKDLDDIERICSF